MPECTNCSKSKDTRRCVYGELKLRHSKYSALSPPEQDDYLAEVLPQDHEAHEAPSPPTLAREQSSLGDSRRDSLTSTSTWPIATQGSPQDYYKSPQSFRDVESPGQIVQRGRRLSTNSASWIHGATQISTNPWFQDTPTTPVECKIFEFYKEYAGFLLDIVSPARHMSQTVPRLTASCLVLRYACLSYAANMLWLRKEIPTSEKDHYHDQVISRMINALATHPNPEHDETLLATAVILRMSEQFYEITEDIKHHLIGAASLFSSRPPAAKWSPYHTDLSGTAFWIYLRETLLICFMSEEACQVDLSLVEHEEVFASAPDEVWTNRSSYLLALACNVYFGGENNLEAVELQTLIELWIKDIPASFRPWCVLPSDDGPFPRIFFYSTWHEVAWHQILAAQVLLAVHALKSYSTTNVLEIHRYTESRILQPARMLARVCFATKDGGASINGGHLLSWCAQFLTQKDEQTAILEWLERSMQKTKWPNKTCIRRLKEVWSGLRTKWSDNTEVSPETVSS